MDENAKSAMEIQSKFELYFVTLIFTMLGLAIQTSPLTQNKFAILFEILSWTFFLFAGFAGMYRIVRIPMILNVFSRINQREKTLNELNSHGAVNPMQPIITDDGVKNVSEVAEVYRVKISELESRKDSINNTLIALFKLQWWLFILAVISLIMARGFEKFLKLFVAN
jgi:hypothetical protein